MAKHYVISDLHGMYDIFEQVCGMLGPEDVVYFLGDGGDRGYDCWRTIKSIYEHPQWVYLKGNHEDMLALGLAEYRDEWARGSEDHDLWMWNGGKYTEEGWQKDGGHVNWINKMSKLPLTAEYTNSEGYTFHMSHAGFTCGHPEQMWGDELVWSRSHFYDKWDEEKFPKDICIHGHTPLEYLAEKLQATDDAWEYDTEKPEAHVYCNGHKIDIDNGAFYTGVTVLYDLDEMKAIPVYDRNWIEAKRRIGIIED